MTPQMKKSNEGSEWAVILAGGDGTRLKSLTRKIAGDDRPKQFCPVLGSATLLEETERRAALEFAAERTLYVVNRPHERYYAPLLTRGSMEHLVAQPSNRGTAPAILYALLRIAARDPEAVVAFLPSDHYVSDNFKFMAHVRAAVVTAQRRPDLIALLGLEPESPEVEYGWIEPSAPIKGQPKCSGVRRFWEKPNLVLAQVLQLRGCLWNSFVMVGSVGAFLDCIQSASAELFRAFAGIAPLIGTAAEAPAVEGLYKVIDEVNFSHQVLAQRPDRLAVLRVAGVRWNDLGEPKRVLASLDMAGIRPQWIDATVPHYA
jgi:mannose-1-phosphate guanylyltransferase